ncbi:Calcium-transporting ATPase 1 [Phytophthora idaei]|nr:Calcium-transporting ATPase 1 [Phytophthora idaei]KAG3252022.1 Calcium-transporting ATPase 1 [Phytophthora idaei]
MSGYESGASLPSRSLRDNANYARLESPRGSSQSFELPAHHVVDVSGDARSFSAADLYHVDAKMATNAKSAMGGRSTPLPDHRSRFLSDGELLLAANPVPTRESFATLNETDEKTWHQRSTELISKMLNTNLERGLNGMDVERRILRYGVNALEEEAKTPVIVIFLLQFYNLIIAMLLFAALASLALQEWVEGIAILAIVTLNAAVATYQEYSASNALAALASLSSPQSLVMRDGMQQVVDSKQLVPGDIVILVTGDVVPADIRLFTSVDLKCNEMLLTGESEDVPKKYNPPIHPAGAGKPAKLTASNMVFSSTTITAGNARGIVVETGMNTRVGSIAALLQAKSGTDAAVEKKWIRNPIGDCIAKHRPKLTPLQRALHHTGYVMGLIAVGVAILVFIVGMIRGTEDPRHPDRPTYLTMIMAAVSVAVSAVPEGLPMVVTICLSSGTAEMVKKNVLVRKLASVETLGAASVICTDKTGTLTEGKMTAVKLWSDFREYSITGKGFTPEGSILSADGTSQAEPEAGNAQVRATLMASVLCSNTQLKQVEGEDGETPRWIPFGNSSEAPLVVAAAKAGIWEDNLLEDYPRLVEVPFSSSRKMMVTVNSVPVVNGTAMFDTLALPGDRPLKLVANVKGAPNYILRNCTQYCRKDGTFETLNNVQRQEILEAVDALSSQALRVLAVAIQPMHELPFGKDCDDVDEKFAALSKPLVFLGLVASIDPERDGVRDAIATARAASIRTVMITGDYLATAVAIAKNIDLLQVGADPNAQATDCTQLRPNGDVYLPPADIDEITSRTLVFARAKPEDKIEIVKSLQRQGLIAAMTGDGVNDAPALKEADIGVAMGISGTEVAKGASDMILTDDNFCSIVSAVEKGRVIYANIQKFVMFLLSTNIGEIILIFISVAGGFPLPLEALHILLLNLFTDGMPAVALSLEKGDPHIMAEKPRHKQSSLIHGRLWLLVLFNAFLLLAGAMTTFLLGLYWNFGELLTEDIYNAGGGTDGTDYTDVTCRRWEGVDDGWRVYGNCAAQYSDGSYIFGEEVAGMTSFENSTVYCEGGDYDCVPVGLGRAQTMVFLGLAFTEVLRAYTVRHFTEPVFARMLSNGYMQLAACMSVILTVLVSNVPVIMDDIFGFEYIPWYQWLVVGAVAVNNAFWGEVLKAFLRRKDRAQARWDHMKSGFEEILLEIRHVRHHVERLEAGGLKRE